MDKKIISVKEATEIAKQNFKNEIEEFNKLKNKNKVENFKELLSNIKMLSFRLNGCFNEEIHKKLINESIDLEEKLLKMYEDEINENTTR